MEIIKVDQTEVDKLYELRLIFLIEKEPSSNKYEQILLNKEQFRLVSNLIDSFATKTEDGGWVMLVDDAEIDLSKHSEIKSIQP